MHRGLLFSLLSLSLIPLSSCTSSPTAEHATNYLNIYNARGHRIFAATGSRSKTIVAHIPQNYRTISQKHVPRTANPSYRYVMHQAKHNVTITLQVYSNYHYAKLSGIPVIGGGSVKLTPQNYQKLNHPQDFID